MLCGMFKKIMCAKLNRQIVFCSTNLERAVMKFEICLTSLRPNIYYIGMLISIGKAHGFDDFYTNVLHIYSVYSFDQPRSHQ